MWVERKGNLNAIITILLRGFINFRKRIDKFPLIIKLLFKYPVR